MDNFGWEESSGQVSPKRGHLDCLLEVEMGREHDVLEWPRAHGRKVWRDRLASAEEPGCSGTMIGMS